MSKELKEVYLYDKDIDCNSYRLRYLEEEGIFNMQFAEILEDEEEVRIYFNTNINENDFKSMMKNIFSVSAEYYSLNDRDLIEEAMEELYEDISDDDKLTEESNY